MALPEIAITAALSASDVAIPAAAVAGNEPRSPSVAVIAAQNIQAREILQEVRAEMQAALIKVCSRATVIVSSAADSWSDNGRAYQQKLCE